MAAPAPHDARRVAAVRRFNRFYTQHLGVLRHGWLESPFSLTEARVLYELAQRNGLTAAEIGRELGLDAGYLSRILKTFDRQGLIERKAADQDGRQRVLSLTEAGRSAFAPLDAASRAQIGGMLKELDRGNSEDLVAAMRTVKRALGTRALHRNDTVTLRPPALGDIGWIIHRQALLYRREYGWDATFEVLLAEIFAGMMPRFDPDMERGWVAERAGDVVGSVFVVRDSDTVAKLRLLYIEPHARGLGLGRRLVDECIAFARGKAYRRLTLWTNDVLKPARRIYSAVGFRLTSAEAVHAFGQDMVSEIWDLDL
jgi:DNA-binding MarR family transcriptional regulator/GNAT superfamily N-acetyltransferase